MKKDITVVRAAISKVVALLTNQAIKVTQRGVQAYVEYDKAGRIVLVNLPYLPDDASESFIAAVQGFLDHEVGHVLYTDSKVVHAAKKAGPRVKNIANIFEDVFVERKMTEAFRGSIGNLDSVRRFHAEQVSLPKIKSALEAGDQATAAGYAGVLQFRAWAGQTIAVDIVKKHPEISALTAEMAARIGPELIAKIPGLNSSKECLALAKAVVEKLMPPPAPPAPPPPGASGDSKPEKGEKGDGGDGGEAPEPEKSDDADPSKSGDCKKSTEADDSGKEREESSKTEEKGAAGGDAGGDHGELEEGSEDADAASGDTGTDDRTEPADDSPAGADKPGDAEPSEPGETPEPGESPRSDPVEASGEEGEGADDSSGERTESIGRHVDDATDTGADSDDLGKVADLGKPFEISHDFDAEASEALTSVALEESRSAEYCVFSTDWDTIEPAPRSYRSDSVEKMEETTRHMISGIQKSLERAMAAKARKTWNPGLRRGRVAPGALFKTAVGDDRVFRSRYETRAKNTAVSLLVDCSGSMSCCDRIGKAGLAAFALSSTLERLKIANEVIGFTTKVSSAMRSAMDVERSKVVELSGRRAVGYARNEALYMPVFKGFGERLGPDAKARIAHLTEHPGWLSENVDGECVQIAAHRLRMQRAERHILIVLSDGEPACPGNRTMQISHLGSVVKALSDKGVEVVGIGIEARAVSRFYPKHLVLNDIAELPTTVVAELTKLLLAD